MMLFCESSISGEIYRWVDEDGNIHYGDNRPADVESDEVVIAPGNRAGDRRPVQTSRSVRSRVKSSVSDSAVDASHERLDRGASSEESCEDAKEQLKILQVALPTYRDDTGRFHNSASWILDQYEGERKYLDDAARSREVGIIRGRIEGSCKDSNKSNSKQNAETEWHRTQNCKIARAELALLSDPGSRAASQEIRDKQNEVIQFCTK